jgi:hypothetical protein
MYATVSMTKSSFKLWLLSHTLSKLSTLNHTSIGETFLLESGFWAAYVAQTEGVIDRNTKNDG